MTGAAQLSESIDDEYNRPFYKYKKGKKQSKKGKKWMGASEVEDIECADNKWTTLDQNSIYTLVTKIQNLLFSEHI